MRTEHRTQNTVFKFLRNLSLIGVISLLVLSCETEEGSPESQNLVSNALSKNQIIETKIKSFITNLDNELIERNSERSEASEAVNIIERALNAKYTKIWQLKNNKSTNLKDSIFLSDKALESLSESDQKYIYNIILKDISKKFWAKYDKSYFPNFIDISLSSDKKGNQRIDWVVKLSKDEVKLSGRTGSCSFSSSDYMEGWVADSPIASCAFTNVGLQSIQQGYFVHSIESMYAYGPDLGLWHFKCRDGLYDPCVDSGPDCSTYYDGMGNINAAGIAARDLDGSELNYNLSIVENVSLDYAQSVGKVVLSIGLNSNSSLCLGSVSQFWNYECERGYYSSIHAPGPPSPLPTY